MAGLPLKRFPEWMNRTVRSYPFRGSFEPPDSLEGTVLSAVKMPAPVSGNSPSFSRRQWLGFATAAAAALVAGSTYWWRFLAFTMSHLTRQLATISAEGVKLSLMSMDPEAITGWLTFYQAPRPVALPENLATLPRKGCHLYQISGHPVSLECFLLPGMKEIHLFCTPAAGLLVPPDEGESPTLRSQAGRTLATWTRAGQTVLLLSAEPGEVIRRLLV